MTFEKYAQVKVIHALFESAEKIKDAINGAFQAKNNNLFNILHQKQSEIEDIIYTLIK